MNPVKHIIATALLFFLISLIIPLDIKIFYWSLFVTVIVDVVDHTANLMLSKDMTTAETRKLIKKEGITSAYSYYYKNRKKGHIVWMIFHNWVFLIIFIILAILLKSWILWMGLVFHFVCDIAENMFDKKAYYTGWSIKRSIRSRQ